MSSPVLIHRASDRVVGANLVRAHERRNAEASCAIDYLVYGDTPTDEVVLQSFMGRIIEPTRHVERCVHAAEGRDVCSHTYDPMPYPEAEPAEPLMYAATGIGLLYGVDGSPGLAAELAGWTLAPRTTR